MTEKTTAWTKEELDEMARQRVRDNWQAYELDERGHKIKAGARAWEGHICPEYEHCSDCVDEAWDCSAAIAFGMMGMAEAIRAR